MDILIVSQYFWPENFRINDLANELVKRNHKVTILTGLPNYPGGKVYSDFLLNPIKYSSINGVRVERVPIFPRGNSSIGLIFNYLSFVIGACVYGPQRLKGLKIDVIFVFGPSPVTVALPAIFIGFLKRAPVLFWVLDLWPDTLEALGIVRSKFILGVVGALVRFIYKRCTFVLAQSPGFLNKLKCYCSDTKKIYFFPNWAEDIFQSSKCSIFPSDLIARSNIFTIVFAGNIGDAQDFPSILQVALSLKSIVKVRWVIVGNGRKFDWLRDQVGQNDLSNEFVLLGGLPLEMIPSIYAHADALLVSLKKEKVFSITIPGKIQSYLMSGIPIIGMLDGEGARVINEANAGIVCDAGDVPGLVNAIMLMSKKPRSELMKLGRNGKIYAQNHFNRETLITKLEAILEESRKLKK